MRRGRAGGHLEVFAGKSAIVTGGASGIGHAIGAQLVDAGAHVVLADIDGDAAADTARELSPRAGTLGTIIGAPLDTRDEAAFRALVADTGAQHGGLDYLFNNAGISLGGPTHEVTSEHWTRIIDVNVRGVVNGILAAYPMMVEQRHGHIVNTASGAGLAPAPFIAAYATTKHAVVGLSVALRSEAALHDVRISALCPGSIETPILDRLPDADLPLTASAPVTAREYLAVVRQKPIAADRFAREALRRVVRNQGVIVVPASARSLWYVQRFSPRLMETITRALARRVDRALVRPPAPEHYRLRMSDEHDGPRFTTHMSDEDALMWLVEKDPILRSTIVAVALFDRPPDFDRLRARIDRATILIPRFRQRVLSPPFRLGPPRWSVEPTFDLDFHLRRIRLPAPGTERTLFDALQPMASAGFDRARPLWEFTLIEGLYDDDGTERAAFAMKVHHAVTDGVGGMALLALLVDLTRDAADPDDTPAVPAPEHMNTRSLVRDSVLHSSRRVLGVARRSPATALGATRAVLSDPLHSGAELGRTARSIGRIVAPATAPMSPVMRDRGLGRRLDVFDLSLDDFKRVAKATEGSVNDVFVAAVLGGLHRYHAHHGDCPDSLRMTLPINLRTAGDVSGGNHFAPARFAVPATITDPRERVQAVRALVHQWRAEPALQLTGQLAGVLNRLPTAATTALFGGMLKCCDFVATNVPGAPVPVYAAGARVERMYAFAPPAGAAVNVSLISHCDTCCIGVVTDTTAVPDAAVLLSCLREGFDELLEYA